MLTFDLVVYGCTVANVAVDAKSFGECIIRETILPGGFGSATIGAVHYLSESDGQQLHHRPREYKRNASDIRSANNALPIIYNWTLSSSMRLIIVDIVLRVGVQNQNKRI